MTDDVLDDPPAPEVDPPEPDPDDPDPPVDTAGVFETLKEIGRRAFGLKHEE